MSPSRMQGAKREIRNSQLFNRRPPPISLGFSPAKAALTSHGAQFYGLVQRYIDFLVVRMRLSVSA